MRAEKHQPVTIATFGDLAARSYALTLTCLPCARTVETNLSALPPAMNYVSAALVCQHCRRPMEKTIRPPTRLTGYAHI